MLAVVLAGAGLALALAAGGVRLAPRLGGVLGAWAAILAVTGVVVVVVRRARWTAAPRMLAALVERAAGSRAGSVVTLLAPAAGGERASAALLAAADARAVDAVARAAAEVDRRLSLVTRRRLWAGALMAATGAALFIAAAPASGRAAAFWHPLRALADARAPVRLAVDHATVRRGDRVIATLEVPGGMRATLWTRGPGETWRPVPVSLDSAGRAIRRLGPLQNDLYLRATSGGRKSAELHVAVALPAFLAELAVTARYPAYLDRPDEAVLPGADTLALPEGTVLQTTGLASVPLAAAGWTRSGETWPLRVSGGRFTGRLAMRASGAWRLALTGEGAAPFEGEPPQLIVRIVPDSAPVVTVPVPGMDTTLPLSLRQPLVIDVRDDHGLSRLSVVSWRVSQTGKLGAPVRDSLDVSGVGDRAIVQGELNALQRGLLPGDTLRFRVEAWDNAPTPHEGVSREYALRLPSREELRAAVREAARDIATAADSLGATQRELNERTNDLAHERARDAASDVLNPRSPVASQTGTLPFQASQRAGEVARQQQAVTERIRELARAVDEIARAAHAAGVDDTAFQARLREVQEMLQRAITPELEQRMRELQDALARLDPEAMRQALQRLAQAQRELRQALERSRELFRRAAVEGQLASLAADAEDLRNRQEEWNRESAPRADTAAAAVERALRERADTLSRGVAEAARDIALSMTAPSPPPLPPPAPAPPPARTEGPLAPAQAAAARARREMLQAAQGAAQGDRAGAGEAGREAAAALDSLAGQLRGQRDALATRWRQEALAALDRAMSETADLAQRQERVVDELRLAQGSAATRAQQASIEEGAAAVAQQIRAASGRHALVSPGLESALGFAQRQMGAARQQLERAQPNTPAAQALAEEALDALNATAYALARSRQAVVDAKSGTGFQEAMEQLLRMAGQQQGLNGDAQSLLPMIGPGAQAVLQQLRALAARQRALAQQLERLQAEGASSAAGPLAQEARDLARQLDAGRLDRPTLERQQRLYRRLLEAGRTLTGPEPDEQQQRTSRPALGDSVHLPGVLAPGATGAGPRLRYPTWEDLNSLSPEQRRLVLEYFRRLNVPSSTLPPPSLPSPPPAPPH
jgi:hypothetical protein